MSKGRTGVWLIGALGSIASTVVAGAVSLRRGLIPPTGMVTALDEFAALNLVPVENFVFGGCDIREGTLVEAVRRFAAVNGAIDRGLLATVEGDLEETSRDICPGTVTNCGDAIRQLARPAAQNGRTAREEIDAALGRLIEFKQARSLEDLIVVNLASTEPPLALLECHSDRDCFEDALDRDLPGVARASTIYACAAVQGGFPYINFTPSSGALVPAVIRMAEELGVPVMGNDGKTGETLVKSALAPMFPCRNLEVMSWEGFNILGNMDGRVLNNPENRESKLKTKDGVLANILGYKPHSSVHIDYVPSLDDQKTAWDFIHFRGFMGAKMSLQFIWQGYDSLLAAPLVLDLARMAEFAHRSGESGLMPHLASYFKAPLGVGEHRLYEQFRMLTDYVSLHGAAAREPLPGAAGS